MDRIPNLIALIVSLIALIIVTMVAYRMFNADTQRRQDWDRYFEQQRQKQLMDGVSIVFVESLPRPRRTQTKK